MILVPHYEYSMSKERYKRRQKNFQINYYHIVRILTFVRIHKKIIETNIYINIYIIINVILLRKHNTKKSGE